MSKILETADGHSVRRTMSHDPGNGSLWLLRGEEDHFPRIAIHISTLRTDAIDDRMDVRDIGRPIMDLIVRSIKRYESQLPSIVEITDAIDEERMFPIDGTTIDVCIANKRKFYLGFPPNAAIHFSTTWRKNNHAGMWSQRTFTAGLFPDDKVGVSDFTRHMKRLAKQHGFNGFRDATYVVRGVLVDDEIDVGTIFEEHHVKYVADSITSITTPPSWLNEEETGRRLSVNARSAFYYRFGEEQNDYVGKINAVPGGLPFFLRFDTGDAVPSEGTIRDAVSFFAHHLRNGEIPYPQVLNGDGLADHNGIFKSIDLWFSTRAELSSPLSSHARTLTHIRYIPDGLSATEADVWKFPSNEALFESERRLLEQGFPNNYGESQATSAYACFSWFGNDGPETFPEIHEFVGPENFMRTSSRHIPECMKEEFAADLASEEELQHAKRKKEEEFKKEMEAKRVRAKERLKQREEEEGVDSEDYASNLESLENELMSLPERHKTTKDKEVYKAKERDVDAALYKLIDYNLKSFLPAITDGKINMDAFDVVFDTMLEKVVNDDYKPQGYGVEVAETLLNGKAKLSVRVYKGFDPDWDDVNVDGVRLSATVSAVGSDYTPSFTLDDNLSLWRNAVDRRFAFTRWAKDVGEAVSSMRCILK